MLQGIAEFWASRVSLENGQYVINGVIPPDEYAVNVSNSVYTNVVAQYSFEFAMDAATILGESYPSIWQNISANIKIPFDSQKQIHPEFDGYNGQTIKQADVVLLGYPLMWNMPEQVRKNDLVYYSARTDPNGPAMTWGMYMVAWLELGTNDDQVNDVFLRSYANIQPPFNVWTETPTGGTVNFITGAGGFLQGMWAGYPGLRIRGQKLDFLNPQLPQGVTGITLRRVHYLGNQVSVSYDAKTVCVSIDDYSNSAAPLYVNGKNGTQPLNTHVPLQFPVGPFSIYSKQ